MLILASRSPRRKELLGLLTKNFQVEPSGFDESTVTERIPGKLVRILAQNKAEEVKARFPEDTVLGCDTIVVSPDQEIFGIPKGEEDAKRMLRALSGRTHRVISGVCVLFPDGKKSVFHKITKVTFVKLSEEDIDWYLSTGEPFDKAGSYGIQGYAGVFVKKISGDFHNVVGLPVQTLRKILQNYKY